MISPRIFGGGPVRRGLGLVLVFAAALDLSVQAAPRRRPSARNLMLNFGAEALATDTLRPSERTFLEKAAAFSSEEVQLARLAISQATGSEVKAFAQQLAADHKQISDSIESLRRKKGATFEAAAGEVISEAAQKLGQKTGADFDREFVRVLAGVHADAVMLFEHAMADAKDTDIRDMLGSYLPMLRDHQNKVNELRKALE
jgi:putative membrane protein